MSESSQPLNIHRGSVNGEQLVQSDLASFTIRHKAMWYAKMIVGGFWLIPGGLAVIFITIWWSWYAKLGNNTYRVIYYMILIVFELTILIICLSFIVQTFILSAVLPTIRSPEHKQKVPVAKHHQRQIAIALNENNQNNAEQVLRRERRLKRTNACSIRFALLVSMIFNTEWTVFNALTIGGVLFHSISVVVITYSVYYNCELEKLLQIIYHSIRSVADVLPGICLILYWKAKSSYRPYAKYLKKVEEKILSVESGKSRKDSLTKMYNDPAHSTTVRHAKDYRYREHTQTLAATNSILSHAFIRAWLLCSMVFCLLYFLLQPVIQSNLFQEICHFYQNIDSSHFVLNMCILRPFIGMILYRSIFLALPVTGRVLFSKLEAVKSFLSTTLITFILFLEWMELVFWNEYMHYIFNIAWSGIYICVFIWSIPIVIWLLGLREEATHEFDKCYGYKPKPSMISWFEGFFILIMYGLYFLFALTSGDSLTSHIRELCQSVVYITQLIMLYALRTIELTEISKNYVAKKKKRYIYTFKVFCVLNIIAFIYSFIRISNTFADLVNSDNKTVEISQVTHLLSYTFSFCMAYYPLWAIEQFDKWFKFHVEVGGEVDPMMTPVRQKPSEVENNNGIEEEKASVNGNALEKSVKSKRFRPRRLSEGNNPMTRNLLASPSYSKVSVSMDYEQTAAKYNLKEIDESNIDSL